jgi:putative transposase|tara:strand:+ start:349 stop:1200 length:852 start_codon:yes stop_codon:yes gene_type:complete
MLTLDLIKRQNAIEHEHPKLSLRQQCRLLSIHRSGLYYQSPKIEADKIVMDKIDRIYTKCPFYGYRKITAQLQRDGLNINKKHVLRLMQKMGVTAIYQKKWRTLGSENKIYPYLLKNRLINKINDVWATDITYIPMKQGFVYLTAIIDWYSRYILSWRLSNTLETDFCISALDEALSKFNKPNVFNTDQGCQYTSDAFTSVLKSQEVLISMDGRGRCYDNIFIERLWRSVKYEEVYLKSYDSMPEAKSSLSNYLSFYNNERIHQSFNYLTPKEIYYGLNTESQ